MSAADRRSQLQSLPIFKRAAEALGAQIWHVDDEFNPYVPHRQRAAAGNQGETDEADETVEAGETEAAENAEQTNPDTDEA